MNVNNACKQLIFLMLLYIEGDLASENIVKPNRSELETKHKIHNYLFTITHERIFTK